MNLHDALRRKRGKITFQELLLGGLAIAYLIAFFLTLILEFS